MVVLARKARSAREGKGTRCSPTRSTAQRGDEPVRAALPGTCGSISSPALLRAGDRLPFQAGVREAFGSECRHRRGGLRSAGGRGLCARRAPQRLLCAGNRAESGKFFEDFDDPRDGKSPSWGQFSGPKARLAGPKRGFLGMMASKSSKNLPRDEGGRRFSR